MGVSVSSWKIKWVMFSVVFISLMYGVEGVFVATGDVAPIVDDPTLDTELNDNETADLFTGFVSFATFNSIPYPSEMAWFGWLLTLIVSIMLIADSYIVYAWAREIIPLV